MYRPMISIILCISWSEGGPSGAGGWCGSLILLPISRMKSSITAGLWTAVNFPGVSPTFLKLCQTMEAMETVSLTPTRTVLST
jgi:hypothetical protein